MPALTHDSLFFCSRTTLLVQLTFEGSRGPSYLPGEHLGIFPGNQTALVQGILERVVDCSSPDQTVCLEVLDESGELLGPDKTNLYPLTPIPKDWACVCPELLASQLMGKASWPSVVVMPPPNLGGGIGEAKPGTVHHCPGERESA